MWKKLLYLLISLTHTPFPIQFGKDSGKIYDFLELPEMRDFLCSGKYHEVETISQLLHEKYETFLREEYDGEARIYSCEGDSLTLHCEYSSIKYYFNLNINRSPEFFTQLVKVLNLINPNTNTLYSNIKGVLKCFDLIENTDEYGRSYFGFSLGVNNDEKSSIMFAGFKLIPGASLRILLQELKSFHDVVLEDIQSFFDKMPPEISDEE